MGYINNTLLRGDYRGYLLKHVENTGDDVVIDTSALPANWNTKAIIYDHISLSFDFGSSDLRKWVAKILINANNKSSLSLSIQSSNDNDKVFKKLKSVIRGGSIIWDDATVIWGDTLLRWNYTPTISAWRRFVAKGLRCQYKQIRFTNDYIEILNSDTTGPISINSSTKEISIDSYPSKSWKENIEEYFISFSNDSYVKEYKILSVTPETITVEDGSNTLVDYTNLAWKIRGYRKGESFSLIDYVINYDLMTETQSAYRDASL